MEDANLDSPRDVFRSGSGDVKRDVGLAALRSATSAYMGLREELLEERMLNEDLVRRLHESDHLTEQEDRRVTSLLASIRQLHRALYAGTTSEHILRAAMDVTDAERGYFLAATTDGLRVRAAIDVPASVGDEASPFIAGIARRVLQTGGTVHWTEDTPPNGLVPGVGETFREGIAVPVSTLGTASGVILALDKDGEFHESDVRSLISVGTEAGVAIENAQLRDEMQDAYIATIALLADAVQTKDAYTHGHCERVAHYARVAAERMSLSEEQRRVTCYAALLHDVGKIGVSDGVLNKPGPLLPEERLLVQAHVRIGYDLLSAVPALRDIALAILYHHERFDGHGYPEGLAGERIPIAARIVAAVDAYCAMIDERSYKSAYTTEHARAELLRCAGTQFDPRVVDAVLTAIDEVNSGHGSTDCGLVPIAAMRKAS